MYKFFKIKEEPHCKTCPYNTMKNSISDVISITKQT